MIVGLSGYAKSGKDTAAAGLVRNGFTRISFAEKLRECMYELDPIVDGRLQKGGTVFTRYSEAIDELGYNKAKELYPEVRKLLQRLGTEAGRNVLGEDVWVNALFSDVVENRDYVITDVRFPNEFEAVKNAGGIIIRIVRPGVGPVNDHPSEVSLDRFPFDATINNNTSIQKLEEKIVSVVKERMLKGTSK